VPAGRWGALRADNSEGTVEAVIPREEPRRARTRRDQASAIDAAPWHRRTAIGVGVLFIVGDIAGVLSYVVTHGLLDGRDALTTIAANQSRLALGALLVLVMGLALAMIPVVMYPIFKRYNEVLALGTVVFRGALETVAYVSCAGTWLVLLELSREPAAVASAGAPHVQTLTGLLVATQGSVATWLISIVFSLGALMFYYLFYQSRLIPRWLSIWGLVGATLYLAAPLLDMFGHGLGLLMAPLAVAEIVLSVWLIAKGLNAPAPNRKSA
jgi:hypothetical protein